MASGEHITIDNMREYLERFFAKHSQDDREGVKQLVRAFLNRHDVRYAKELSPAGRQAFIEFLNDSRS